MSVDYSVLDHFCKAPTWDTPHGHDERRLKEALVGIIHEPDFDPFDAIDYIRQNHGNPTWGITEEKKEAVLARLLNTISGYWVNSQQPRCR
jgi:hypothetical protein